MSPALDDLAALRREKGEEIDAWFAARRCEAPPYIYTSVDIRHAGYKLAPVDTNLFPAGFNNLSPAALTRAEESLRGYFEARFPQVRKLLIVPESHTRNLAYLENLAVLDDLLKACGMETVIGTLMPQTEPLRLTSMSGREVVELPLRRSGVRLETADGWRPDVILLNHDLTSGVPPLLQDVVQPIIPPPEMGWHRRRKSVHFAAYEALVADFCERFGGDPWRMSALFHRCGRIDFRAREGIDCVARMTDRLIARIAAKYAQYGITDEPYVFIKAESGTYGMGIMTAHSGGEVIEMNKKTRHQMQVIKEGTQSTEVIIQEGVPTVDAVEGASAEPVMYLVDGCPVGGMYRVHAGRDPLRNLNAPGMHFTGMCDESESTAARVQLKNCNFHAFGLVAGIAALAVARERYEDKSDAALEGYAI